MFDSSHYIYSFSRFRLLKRLRTWLPLFFVSIMLLVYRRSSILFCKRSHLSRQQSRLTGPWDSAQCICTIRASTFNDIFPHFLSFIFIVKSRYVVSSLDTWQQSILRPLIRQNCSLTIFIEILCKSTTILFLY